MPKEVIRFLNGPSPSSRTMTLESTQTLAEISTSNLPGGKGRPARKVDNSPPSLSELSGKCGSLDVSQRYGSPRPVTRMALSLLLIVYYYVFYLCYLGFSFMLSEFFLMDNSVLVGKYSVCKTSWNREGFRHSLVKLMVPFDVTAISCA
jgi:hypothetical protein